MAISFGHVAILAEDVELLATFYTQVFGCTRNGPPRDLSGAALETGMGLAGAHVRGVHLTLPGGAQSDSDSVGSPPVLEIFSLPSAKATVRDVDRLGLMHLCFRVDDLRRTVAAVTASGGSMQGAVATVGVEGVGSADFVYLRDPEGNLVELQQWNAAGAVPAT